MQFANNHNQITIGLDSRPALGLGLIWAQARNGVIGINNKLPWHLPEDLSHFKLSTIGCQLIMGRKTWDSLPAAFRPLPGRKNIVITRQPDWEPAGAHVAQSFEHALSLLDPSIPVWVMGGESIYPTAP